MQKPMHKGMEPQTSLEVEIVIYIIENGHNIAGQCHFSSVLEFRIKAKWADKAASTRSAVQRLEVVLSTVEKPLLNTALSNYDFLFSSRGPILDLIFQVL